MKSELLRPDLKFKSELVISLKQDAFELLSARSVAFCAIVKLCIGYLGIFKRGKAVRLGSHKPSSSGQFTFQLDFPTLSKLYAVSDMHLDDFAGHRLDSALVESPTRLNGFSLNTGVVERLKCDDNAVSHLFVEAILVEECTPQRQRCCIAIG